MADGLILARYVARRMSWIVAVTRSGALYCRRHTSRTPRLSAEKDSSYAVRYADRQKSTDPAKLPPRATLQPARPRALWNPSPAPTVVHALPSPGASRYP